MGVFFLLYQNVDGLPQSIWNTLHHKHSLWGVFGGMTLICSKNAEKYRLADRDLWTISAAWSHSYINDKIINLLITPGLGPYSVACAVAQLNVATVQLQAQYRVNENWQQPLGAAIVRAAAGQADYQRFGQVIGDCLSTDFTIPSAFTACMVYLQKILLRSCRKFKIDDQEPQNMFGTSRNCHLDKRTIERMLKFRSVALYCPWYS